MFPTLSKFTHTHPRYVAVFGLALFLCGVTILGTFFYQSEQQENTETTVEKFDARLLLNAPDTANSESVERYESQVKENAVSTDTITVGAGCSMDPLIVRLPENSVLKLNNVDATEHTIAFEDQNFFNVSASSTREINITEVFGKGAGIYRYRCNDQSLEEAVGVFYIVAQQ
jgi:plastocyanin